LRYTVALPENSTFNSLAVSPDGRYVAVAAAVNGKRQLWLRPLDGLQVQPMAGTEDAEMPFWSPDSRFIAFGAEGRLKKIAANGGPPQSLCNAPGFRGGSWNRDDIIVFSSENGIAGIQKVPAGGGAPAKVVSPSNSASSLRYPVFLPDGRRVLYTVLGGATETGGIYVVSLDGRDNRRLLSDVSSVEFVPSLRTGGTNSRGHLLFVRENTLMAQPFDPSTAQSSGDVFPVVERVGFATHTDLATFGVSENGVMLYRSAGPIPDLFIGGETGIVWYDRSGKRLDPAVPAPDYVGMPALSPDEKSIVFTRSTKGASGNSDLWIRDLLRGTDRRLTSDPSQNFAPFWSPKGDRIVFHSNRAGHLGDLYQQAVNGSGQAELLVSSSNLITPTQWSRGGRFIVYLEIDPKTQRDIWVLPMDDGSSAKAKPVLFLQTPFNETQGQLSADNRWMAYTSDDSGQREVYVRPFPVAEGIWKISTAGGSMPRWAGDGKELFYVSADGKMMAVAVMAHPGNGTQTKPSFVTGNPVALFQVHLANPGAAYLDYDVTADGKRFLVNVNASDTMSAAATPLTVVVNWTADPIK
jgi:Tol biopolymer transport system component